MSPAATDPILPEVAPAPGATGAVPLSSEEFAHAMATLGPFERQPAIAVGVSGGPDSMALAVLLRDWIDHRRGRLLALVVDHRLRPESGDEAKRVAGRLAAIGIRTRILTRSGPIPPAGLQAAARTARYALMTAAAAAEGILHLAVAHHRRDQAETVAMRLAAGSGRRGAAGMAAIRELDRVRLIRPLLLVEPGRLKALLERQDLTWIEDPSNRDPQFWRARHRAGNAGAATAATSSAAADERRTLDATVADLLARHARPHSSGFVQIAASPLVALEDGLLESLLGRLIVTTGGGIWPPRRAELARLADWLRRGAGRRASLGGVLIERAGHDIRLVREPRAVAGPALLPCCGIVWDGRFRITFRSAVHSRAPLDMAGHRGALSVAAAGSGWRRRLAQTNATGVYDCEPSRLPTVVLETLPLVRAGDLALLLGPWPLDRLGYALEARFRPRNRYAAVPFEQTVSPSVASSREKLMYDRSPEVASGNRSQPSASASYFCEAPS